MSKTEIPSIRFHGFDDAWEQHKLASLCEKFTDGDWIESKDQSDFGVRLVQTGNVGVAEYLDKPNNKKWISEDTFDRLHCEEVLPGDILISRLPEPAGRACIMPLLGTKMITAVDCTIVRTAPDMSNKFLVQYLSSQSYFDDVNICLAGGTRQRISRGNLANFDVPIPVKKSEQDAIGMFFGYLDNLITLHQRKFEKLTNVKKSMLEKMFPRNGSCYPEIRFKGFTDPWEQRKLGELISEYKETVDSSCTLPVLTSSKTEGVILQEEHFGRKQQHDITGYNVLPRSYCTYRNRSDGVDFTFNVNECCDMGIISKFYPVFCGNDNDTYFLSLVLNNSDEVVHEIAYTCTGTGQKVLSFLDLQKMSIRVPRHNEQKKISTYFKQLDHLITLHQRELEKLQSTKKALLEKMFF